MPEKPKYCKKDTPKRRSQKRRVERGWLDVKCQRKKEIRKKILPGSAAIRAVNTWGKKRRKKHTRVAKGDKGLLSTNNGRKREMERCKHRCLH